MYVFFCMYTKQINELNQTVLLNGQEHLRSVAEDLVSKIHSLSSGKVEMYVCAACHALTFSRKCVKKLNRHCS